MLITAAAAALPLAQGEVEQISMMKPKGASEHETGLLEYLEDIIGTDRYIPQLEESSKRCARQGPAAAAAAVAGALAGGGLRLLLQLGRSGAAARCRSRAGALVPPAAGWRR